MATKFHPTERKLKNNKVVLIRAAEAEDAAGLVDTIKTYLHDSEYIPLEPGEFEKTDEEAKSWVESFLKSENSILLIAVYEDKIIGNIDVNGSQRRALKHTGMIGMGILKEWRNTGLGSELLNCAIDWCRQNPVLEKLWLQVYSDNVPGISIYKKAGFVETGIQKNFFKNAKNEYFDNITMMMDVK